MPRSAKRVINPARHQHRLPPPAKTVFLSCSSCKDKPLKERILFGYKQKAFFSVRVGFGCIAKSGWPSANAAERTGFDGSLKVSSPRFEMTFVGSNRSRYLRINPNWFPASRLRPLRRSAGLVICSPGVGLKQPSARSWAASACWPGRGRTASACQPTFQRLCRRPGPGGKPCQQKCQRRPRPDARASRD